ncbi:BPSL0761 family protein [Paraburkholderia sediminicola]|uniref:BPSL0761 family protein n=1 Tax=Paraburkholderia sediminicola TaxID=458836 RepID=UPI0038BCC76F
MPDERTNAVVDTREFLRVLVRADEVTIPGLVQSVAASLLRHYPLDVDLAVSALSLPGIWAPPRAVICGDD